MATITVLGAGNYGTALANIEASKGHRVNVWTVEEDVYNDVKQHGMNSKYLPGVALSQNIDIHMDLERSLEDAELVIIAVPSHVVREVMRNAAPILRTKPELILVDVAKGLEAESFLRMSQVIEEELKRAGADHHKVVALSGPCLAKELSRRVPTAVMVASKERTHARRAKELLETEILNIYDCDDVVGVEVGGVLKNIIALMSGMCDGAKLGMNTKAALFVAMLEEIITLGEALGARRRTLYGLAGLGDVIATAMSTYSRNHTLGRKLGEGKTLEEARSEMHMVTEGVTATAVAVNAAEKHKLELPLIRKQYEILFEGRKLDELLSYFLSPSYTELF